MRRIVAIIGLAYCVAACDPVTVQEANQSASTALTAAKKVQAYAITACNFEPTLASIAALFNASAGMTIDAVGGAICNAVTSIPLADGGTRKIIVNGVRIKGKRIVAFLK